MSATEFAIITSSQLHCHGTVCVVYLSVSLCGSVSLFLTLSLAGVSSHVSAEDSLAPVAGFLAPVSHSWMTLGHRAFSPDTSAFTPFEIFWIYFFFVIPKILKSTANALTVGSVWVWLVLIDHSCWYDGNQLVQIGEALVWTELHSCCHGLGALPCNEFVTVDEDCPLYICPFSTSPSPLSLPPHQPQICSKPHSTNITPTHTCSCLCVCV